MVIVNRVCHSLPADPRAARDKLPAGEVARTTHEDALAHPEGDPGGGRQWRGGSSGVERDGGEGCGEGLAVNAVDGRVVVEADVREDRLCRGKIRVN